MVQCMLKQRNAHGVKSFVITYQKHHASGKVLKRSSKQIEQK